MARFDAEEKIDKGIFHIPLFHFQEENTALTSSHWLGFFNITPNIRNRTSYFLKVIGVRSNQIKEQ